MGKDGDRFGGMGRFKGGLRCKGWVNSVTIIFTFTFMHLADAFIQTRLTLNAIQGIHFFQCVCSLGIEPTTFCATMQCSTTEPQEHLNVIIEIN